MAKLALVTGSAGFVGRHMVDALRLQGWRVHPVDIADRYGPLDANRLFMGPVETGRYDLVVHCAARAPHRAAIDGNLAIHPYNAALDANMFNWAIRTGVGRVLYFSSSAVYPVGLQRELGYLYRLTEDDAFAAKEHGYFSVKLMQDLADGWTDLMPDAGYGRVKLAGEQLAAYTRAAGVPVTVVRPFSGYGTDQSEDFPFGAFLMRAHRREDPFTLWNAQAVRDWVHIDDVVAGALELAHLGVDEAVNLCTGTGYSAAEVAQMLAEAFGYQPHYEILDGAPRGVHQRVGDPEKLHSYYKPRITLEEGVQRARKELRG